MAECGSCNLCCKLLAVKVIDKPRNVWCKHCDIGSGCRIYDTRPEPCRDFSCFWLQGQEHEPGLFPPELKPDSCHVVIDGMTNQVGLVLHVDPAYPGAEKKHVVRLLVERTLKKGIPVVVATGEKRYALKMEAIHAKPRSRNTRS